MEIIKKIVKSSLPVLLFFLAIFDLSVIPLRDFDLWFHIKSGEIIAKLGIIHYDVFSYNTAGREWFPYEWLFQVWAYFTQQITGFDSIKYYIAVVITIQIAILFYILRRILTLGRYGSMTACFIFFVSVFEFYSARPHVFAYTFLMATIALILLLILRKRNLLFLIVPLILVWSNMHGSIFLAPYLAGAYGAIALVMSRFGKGNKGDRGSAGRRMADRGESNGDLKRRGIILLGVSALFGVLSILPPLGILQYRLLWTFFRQQKFISTYIEEWTPLIANPAGFIIFSASTSIILALFIFTLFKRKRWKESVWFLPLLSFIFLAYSASRNVFLGYISLILIFGFTLSKWQIKGNRFRQLAYAAFLLVLVGVHLKLLILKDVDQRLYYPVNAAKFIKANLKGHMFNEYGYGGYLLYQLYPVQKVFFDGRTDLYLCCEMKDTLEMATKKNEPDGEYKKLLDGIWNKYHISFMVMRTEKHMILRKMARILTDDPGWSLVFWDDFTQVFVRKDGLNSGIVDKYGAKYATPYNKDPFPSGREDEALAEYERMETVADSAKSRNAIGYIYLIKSRFDEAKKMFEAAVQIDPQFESPYMNLAELAVRDGDLATAIKLYEKARYLASDRGLVYIRLGQLYLQAGYKDKAREIWTQGVKNTVDTDAKDKLKNMLEN